MSSFVKIAIPATKSAVSLLKQYWPAITAALGLLVKFLADHPNIPSWFRDRISDFASAIKEAAKQPDKAVQVRNMIAAVRKQATEMSAYLDADRWNDQADVLESQVSVAESQPPGPRKKALKQVRKRTDVFVASFTEALTRIYPAQSGPTE